MRPKRVKALKVLPVSWPSSQEDVTKLRYREMCKVGKGAKHGNCKLPILNNTARPNSLSAVGGSDFRKVLKMLRSIHGMQKALEPEPVMPTVEPGVEIQY